MIYGLVQLIRAHQDVDSSFRRNRGTLILLGTLVSLAGGFIDFARFILARFMPAADLVYPIGIPANMVFALMLGHVDRPLPAVRVKVAVKKTAVYVAGGRRPSPRSWRWRPSRTPTRDQRNPLWVIVPLGFVITLLVSPLGQRLEDRIQRVMFSKRRGCYETLLDLSKRMSSILNFNELVDTLVHGLVRGMPAHPRHADDLRRQRQRLRRLPRGDHASASAARPSRSGPTARSCSG